jgi:hypothetical protein
MRAKPRQNFPDHSKETALVMEVEQRCFIKFFMEEGTKGVEIIGRLKK